MSSAGSAARRSDPGPVPGRGAASALSVLAARTAPVVAARTRVLEVPPALAEALPEGGLRRGSTVAVGTGPVPGALSLTLHLLGAASAAGAWCAAVAVPDLGLVAAAEAGVAVERLVLVPRPGDQWPVVVAALLESLDVVVARPAGRVRVGDARRLAARARERGAVLVVLDPPAGRARAWPEGVDLRLEVTGGTWSGLGSGHGYLRARDLEVAVTGRRAAARTRAIRLRLPGDTGAALPALPVGVAGEGGEPLAAAQAG